MSRLSEHNKKVIRLQKLIEEQNLDGICLFTFVNYSWFSAGGSNRVVTGSERGCSVLILMQDGTKYVTAPQNEAARIINEEVGELDFKLITFPWYENVIRVIKDRLPNKKLGADVDIPGMINLRVEIDRLRFSLTDEEVLKARDLSMECSLEIAKICANLKPGMTEYQIGAEISKKFLEKEIRPAVLLIGVDERLKYCKHPVLTDKSLEKYAMISIVGEKHGLHTTLTRSVNFGKISSELQQRYDAVCLVDAMMCNSTKLGTSVQNVFEFCKKAYEKVGFKDGWQAHHQGGAIGYASREFRANERDEIIRYHQMFGWNPIIEGTKSEETILVGNKGFETLTSVPHWWPTKEYNGVVRPQILEF